MSYKKQNLNYANDVFWSMDLSILWDKNRLIEFFPTKDMTLNEKMNSIARLSVYATLVLVIYKGQLWPLYIGLLGMAMSLFLQNSSNESNINSDKYISAELNKIEGETTDLCTAPTKDNPFMNISVNEYIDNPTRSGACDPKTVSEETEAHFNVNLYKDVDDLFGKNNSQRMFVTNPITTIPNDQQNFAKWLYSTPSTCKEDQENCLRYEDVRANRKPLGDFENNPINLFEDQRVL